MPPIDHQETTSARKSARRGVEDAAVVALEPQPLAQRQVREAVGAPGLSAGRASRSRRSGSVLPVVMSVVSARVSGARRARGGCIAARQTSS